MHHHNSDPNAVAAGAALLDNELRRSLIMPRPEAALRQILWLLNSATEALYDHVTDDRDAYAAAAGLLIALLDGYHHALAELGGRQ